MGYDLRPRNKVAGDFQMGAFSWSWMMDNGVGLPVGYGPGFWHGSACYRVRPDGLMPQRPAPRVLVPANVGGNRLAPAP